MNNFYKDLEYSVKNSDNENEMLSEFYKKAFPDSVRIEEVTDIPTQKKGIDKIIHLKNGNSLFIDEKKRRKDYGDILIEEYSDFDRKKKGWMSGEKHTDFIVYFIPSSGKIYLFPFYLLRNAFIRNYNKWVSDYGRKFAKNEYYRTSNIPIPTKVLLDSVMTEITNQDE